MFSKATIVSAIFGLAAAQLHPAVGEPKGNPITRPLNEVVPTCEKFTITWEPTTPNTVSVLLLKGPASNVVKFGPALAQGIANSGSLAWTPASDLPLTDSPNGYGIQIIDDVTGQYQYSTQFGLKAGKCEDASKPSASSSPVATPEPAKSTPAGYATNTPVPQSSAAGYPTLAPYPTTVATQSSPAPAAGTGMPYPNGTVPAGAATPTAGRPMNTTTGGLPEVTANAASSVQAGLGLAGAAAAAMAFML